jgi:hypothetical protein
MFVDVEEVEDLRFQWNVEKIIQTISTNVDIYKNLVSRKLIRFHQYLVDVENYKCPLSWWLKE